MRIWRAQINSLDPPFDYVYWDTTEAAVKRKARKDLAVKNTKSIKTNLVEVPTDKKGLVEFLNLNANMI